MPTLAAAQAAAPPGAADAAEAAQPVRVVCVADSPAALPAGADGRVQAFVMSGRYVTPLGSGFVVDPDRRHVLGSWSAVSACRQLAGGPPRQLGVLEPGDREPVLAALLPERAFQDSRGRSVPLIQALCRMPARACGADLPLGDRERPLPAAERQRQRANVLVYAPDLALLRLPRALRSAPLSLALTQPLDDQMRLIVRGHAPALAGGEAGLAALALPLSTGAVYIGPEQFSQPQAGAEVHARLHRLAASLAPGQAGAALLRHGQVVGVLSAAHDLPAPNAAAGAPPNGPPHLPPHGPPTTGPGIAHAVPATVVAAFLNLLGVPYLHAADASPAAAVPAPAAADGGWPQRQRRLLLGAVLLALLAALAFVLLARRTRAGAAALPDPKGLATAARPGRSAPAATHGNATLLHAVALPTEVPTQPAPGAWAADHAPNRVADPASPATAAINTAAAVYLRVLQGPLAAAVYALPMPRGGGTALVGRDPQACQIVFPPELASVSAVHACFSWDLAQQQLSLRDMSSSGTWLNGERIDKARTLALQHGDEVDLGGPGLNRVQIDIPGATPRPTEART